MTKYKFTGLLRLLTDKAKNGSAADIDFIMNHLTHESNFAMTRYVDFAISLVTTTEGFERLKHYLFCGTLIQRNYASLYFNRLGEWEHVKEAFEQGLIDDIQAFAR